MPTIACRSDSLASRMAFPLRCALRRRRLRRTALDAPARLVNVEHIPQRGDLARGIAADHQGVRRPSGGETAGDRKSTRLNSSHGYISYAVFCLKKKKKKKKHKEK